MLAGNRRTHVAAPLASALGQLSLLFMDSLLRRSRPMFLSPATVAALFVTLVTLSPLDSGSSVPIVGLTFASPPAEMRLLLICIPM